MALLVADPTINGATGLVAAAADIFCICRVSALTHVAVLGRSYTRAISNYGTRFTHRSNNLTNILRHSEK